MRANKWWQITLLLFRSTWFYYRHILKGAVSYFVWIGTLKISLLDITDFSLLNYNISLCDSSRLFTLPSFKLSAIFGFISSCQFSTISFDNFDSIMMIYSCSPAPSLITTVEWLNITYITFKRIVHIEIKMYSPSGHAKCRWVCFFIWTDMKKLNITSVAHQWILCSKWVPSE